MEVFTDSGLRSEVDGMAPIITFVPDSAKERFVLYQETSAGIMRYDILNPKGKYKFLPNPTLEAHVLNSDNFFKFIEACEDASDLDIILIVQDSNTEEMNFFGISDGEIKTAIPELNISILDYTVFADAEDLADSLEDSGEYAEMDKAYLNIAFV